MRVSARGYSDLLKTSLSRPSERIGRLYVQLTSGQRLTGLSDDPLTATRVVQAHGALAELSSRRFVINEGTRLLGGAEVALGQMGEALQQVQDVGLRATSSALGDSERRALAQEVRHLSDTLRVAGNQAVQGKHVFAGTRTDTAPFAARESGGPPVAYLGNHQRVAYQVSPTETVAAGFTGAEVANFADASGGRPVAGVDTDVFSLLEDLADSIARGDSNRVELLHGQVTACYDHVVGLRGQVGVRTQRYEAAGEACEWSELRLQELLTQEEDLDMAEAVVELRQEETAYQAVMGVTSRLLALPSLFEGQW